MLRLRIFYECDIYSFSYHPGSVQVHILNLAQCAFELGNFCFIKSWAHQCVIWSRHGLGDYSAWLSRIALLKHCDRERSGPQEKGTVCKRCGLETLLVGVVSFVLGLVCCCLKRLGLWVSLGVVGALSWLCNGRPLLLIIVIIEKSNLSPNFV